MLEVFVILVSLVALVRTWTLPGRLADLEEEAQRRRATQRRLQEEVEQLREQLALLREAGLAPPAPVTVPPPPRPVVVPMPVAAPAPVVAPTPPQPVAAPVMAAPVPAVPSTPPMVSAPPVTAPAPVPPVVAPAPAPPVVAPPVVVPPPAATPAPLPVPSAQPPVVAPPVAPPAPPVTTPPVVAPVPPSPTLPPVAPPVARPVPPAPVLPPVAVPRPAPVPEPEPVLAATSAPDLATPAGGSVAAATDPAPAPKPVAAPPVRPPVPPAPPRRPVPPPAPVPTGPTWWERAATVLLENWTGILGAVVLVTGVGFLGIYTALRLAPPYRFLLICLFAVGLLGARFALRRKEFARQLNAWLLSSAAAIFLFACVGAVSIPGLRWATAPFDYLLLLAGVSANLYLAWRTSRESVATLHGVLSLVGLAVLPPTALTLGAGAAVTIFSIAITYRQRWRYQLLLSIASFFAFHLYWHQQLRELPGGLRLTAMALVLAVGAAAALVQYRRVYAQRRFEPLLFAAHLLNWTCLGFNLYLYSTGSVWKTIPLGLGALLTYWTGQQARRLGIAWLFQTDTILSLMLALATALSLQGWHATPTVIGLFMLLEALLVALVMARQREALVYRVALAGAGLAGAGLLLLAVAHAGAAPPATLYRDALTLALAGWAALTFTQLILRQPLLTLPAPAADADPVVADDIQRSNGAHPGAEPAGKSASHRALLNGLAVLAGLLQAGAGLLLARVLFGWAGVPVAGLLAALLGLAAAALGLGRWLQTAGLAPDWLRRQQVVLGQGLLVLVVFGLHELGLTWTAVLLVLYVESLAAILVLVRRDALLYRYGLSGALLAGISLLLAALGHLGDPPAILYRDAGLLVLAAGVSLAFARRSFRQLATPAGRSAEANARASAADSSLAPGDVAEALPLLLRLLAGLGGLLQAGAGLLLGWVVFQVAAAPVATLLAALGALAGLSLGAARWMQAAPAVPDWVRRQQLVLGQGLLVLAVFGLHELGLSWPALLLVLYLESLAAVLALARRDALLYQYGLGAALLAGTSLLPTALSHVMEGAPGLLYRDAGLLALAAGASVAFGRHGYRQLAASGAGPTATWPFAAGEGAGVPAALLGLLAGLAGGLQATAGLLLGRVVFGWSGVPVATLLGALVGLAGLALGLGRWLQTAALAPDWLRRQQLILTQGLLVLAVFGLHELGLNWTPVLLVLYVESLAAVLLLVRRDALLYQVGLGTALVAGVSLLAAAMSHVVTGRPVILYRDAGLLVLAAGVSLAYARAGFRQLAGGNFWLAVSEPAAADADEAGALPTLLGLLAGLAGWLQVGTGLLLARVVFHYAPVPVAATLGALAALAGLALAGAAWVSRADAVPAWVQRQQLVVGQYAIVLALLGLHELGLSWPAVSALLYAENLLAALLLNGRRQDGLLHLQTYLLVGLAAALPLLVRHASPGAIAAPVRAALLLGAGLLTVTYQLRARYWSRAQADYACPPLGPELTLPLLGLAAGWLLLGAGALSYAYQWAGWVALAVLGGLLVLRQRVAVPGLWAGLLLAGVGYLALQWSNAALWQASVLRPAAALPGLGAAATWLYLLPTALVPVVALATYWWPAGGRFVRWPWLYLLGAHLAVGVAATATTLAALVLGWLTLALAAFAAAQWWRRALPDEAAVARAGQPDRYLLHLAYALLAGSLGLHLLLPARTDTFFDQPAEYFTAAALFAALAGLAAVRPPATGPTYRSWRWLHPWLPEVALLFGTATLFDFVRGPWLPLLWVGAALVLGYLGPEMSPRFRRLAVYGRFYYWLAAASISYECLVHVTPALVPLPEWWALVAATALLLGYVGLTLREGGAVIPGLAPAWDELARPDRRTLEALLLYPAFVALSLLLIQSFDRSVLTVLLMLEVLAVFSASLLLRRQDLRYVALAGMLGCLVRLVFFDLSRSNTITRAIVFIFMGLLLLGMNALYARFKTRLTGGPAPDEPAPADEDAPADEPQPLVS